VLNQKLALLAILVGIFLGLGPDRSQAAKLYQISLFGTKLGTLQRVKNCLDYHVCKPVESSVAGGNPDFRLHLFVNLERSELEWFANECGVDQDQTRMVILDGSTRVPESILLMQAKNLEMKAPIDIPFRPLEDLQRIHDETANLIRNGSFDEAIQYALDSFGIPLGGYRIVISKDPKQEFSQTDHFQRVIEIGRGHFFSPCNLFLALRHEAEHVKQVRFDDSCRTPTTFTDHFSRERSAYLNDVRTIKRMCPDSGLVMAMELNSLLKFQKSYTHKTD
jgi:hypothetical protein